MQNINLELYKVFCIVAKYNSMTKAADVLNVSQPAVSKSIKTLEDLMGSALFYRVNRNLSLTKEGELLYSRINTAIEAIFSAEDEFESFKELKTGEIKIGISSTLTKCILMDTLKSFKLKYPEVKISIINGLTSELTKKLNDGEVDFVIYNGENIGGTKITELTYSFFYNPVFFKNDKKDIRDYPLILQKKNSNTRKELEKYLGDLNPYMEVVSQDLIGNMVESGLGVGFALDKLIDLSFPDMEKIKVDEIKGTNVYLLDRNSNTIASSTFIKELKKNLS